MIRAGGRARTTLYLASGVAVVFGLAALAGLSVFRQAPASAPAGDPDLVEEATEDWANALLDFAVAVRDGRRSGMESLLASRLRATPFPAVASPLMTPAAADGPWVRRHGWTLAPEAREMWHTDLVESIDAFRRHFSTIEDVRFTVPSAVVAEGGSPIECGIAFAIVGRDAEGRREWVRGEAEGVARRTEPGGWRLERLVLRTVESMVAERDLFTDVTAAAGLTATDPPVLEHPTLGLAAYGAATADLDRDGRLDLVVTAQGGNALYLQSPDGTFRDVADQARIRTLPSPATAPLLLDYDNDGDTDLFLSAVGDQALFENRLVPEGRLVFRDVSLTAGVALPAAGFSAVSGDVDRDGWPDVYVTSYNHYGAVIPDSWDSGANGLPNLLFMNQRNGTFREQAEAWGAADRRWSYAAQFADVDEDGDLDLYVANDFGGGNGLFMNTGTRFVDDAAARGVVDQAYSMGVSFGDPDNDGDLDLHVTRMSSIAGRRILGRLSPATFPPRERLLELRAGNALYRNLGGGRFRDVSAAAGPFPGGWGWGGGFCDIDNDSWLDLVTPNGFLSGASQRDTASLFWREVVASRAAVDGLLGAPRAARNEAATLAFLRRQGELMTTQGYSFSGYERDLVALNRGDGTFLDISGVSGADSGTDGRAAVFADFDDDGDADVFLRAMHGPAHVMLRNEIGQDRGWLRIALEGRASGRDAWGAVVRIRTANGIQTRLKSGGDGFVSQSDPRLLFGLGSAAAVDELEVVWPSGLRQRFPGPAPNRSWRLVEGDAALRAVREERRDIVRP